MSPGRLSCLYAAQESAHVNFQCPVFVGDEVSCYAKILKVGRISITVKVEAGVKAAKMSAIGTKQTCSMRWQMSAFGGKADIDKPLPTNLDLW